MKIVEKEFIERGLVIMQPSGKWFVMSKNNALEFVEACKKNSFGILGIDGFYLKEKGIQPSMDNSIDFTISSYSKSKDYFEESTDFLLGKKEDLYFEIVCRE